MGAFRTDPSITLRGVSRPFDPIQALSRIANLRRLQQAGQFNQFRLEEAQQERVSRQAIQGALTGGGTRADILSRLQGIDPLTAFKLQDEFAEQKRQKEKDEVALLTTNLENARSTAELMGQLAAPIAAAEESETPASSEALQVMYADALARLPQEVAAKLPQQYEPGMARQAILEAVSIKDQINQVLKAAQLKQKQEQAKVASADRAAARAVTERGQDIQLQIAQEALEARGTRLEAKQTQEQREKVVRVDASISNLGRLANVATQLKAHPGLNAAVGAKNVFTNVPFLGPIPGTEAASFVAQLETLRAQVAFRTLQNMRELSKTGGALGQVSEVEISLLQNAIAALGVDQTEGQFRESLDAIVSFVDNAKTSLRSALQQDAKGTVSGFVITDEMVKRFAEQQGISEQEARSDLEAQNK